MQIGSRQHAVQSSRVLQRWLCRFVLCAIIYRWTDPAQRLLRRGGYGWRDYIRLKRGEDISSPGEAGSRPNLTTSVFPNFSPSTACSTSCLLAVRDSAPVVDGCVDGENVAPSARREEGRLQQTRMAAAARHRQRRVLPQPLRGPLQVVQGEILHAIAGPAPLWIYQRVCLRSGRSLGTRPAQQPGGPRLRRLFCGHQGKQSLLLFK